jgi:hypothetical protein
MSLLFTNNEMLYGTNNVATITAKVFRYTHGTAAPVLVYGPVGVNVQVSGGLSPIQFGQARLTNIELPSHNLHLDWNGTTRPDFRIIYGQDYVFVEGHRAGIYNGYYRITEVILPDVTPDVYMDFGGVNLDCIVIKGRWLGATKEGDIFPSGGEPDPQNRNPWYSK